MSQPYLYLLTGIAIHFVIMYALTFVAVNRVEDISWFNTRSAYMAGVMVASMVIVMLLVMRQMYTNTKLNLILYGASLAIFVFCFVGVRQQVFVGNENFLRSMIPHHSGAITMCRQATITHAELQQLCAQIVQGQQEEIDQMRRIQQRLP